MIVAYRTLLLILPMAFSLVGCAAPTATLELITVARKGILSAQESQAAQHAEIVERLKAQTAALDSAFDADVRLAAAGQIAKPDGRPVELTVDWIISARKGYVAARDLLSEQIRSAEAAHVAGQDNLKAADEALEMASQLTVQQWNIAERIKQHLIAVQRRLVHD